MRPVGASAGLRVLLDLPAHGPTVAELCERALERSMLLHDVEGRNAIVVGYGALSEHDSEAGLDALCDLLAEAYG